MYDAASTILAQKLSQVSGVGQVTVGGSSLPAVRVELSPESLNKYGVGLEDVRAVLAAANANRPKGSLEDGDRHWQIYANDQAKKAAVPATHRFLPAARPCNCPMSRTSSIRCRTQCRHGQRQALGAGHHLPPAPASIIETVDRVTALVPSRASIPGRSGHAAMGTAATAVVTDTEER
jgi:multidrug efflux pump